MATKMTREEAINKVRQMNLPKETMEILEALVPELAESEDERIRRWLCDYFSSIDKAWIHKDITCIDILRWLEKQKEQKKEKFPPYVTGFKGHPDPAGTSDLEEAAKEYASKTLCDPDDGPSTGLAKESFIAGAEWQKEQKPAEWSEEDEEMLNSCISSIEESKENRYAYKETDGDTSYDREVDWLKSLRPQPKKGYSDEDEDRISDVLWCIEQSRKVAKNENDMGTCWSAERFVKSLRPQQRQEWSDEEKEILDSILSHYVLIDKPIDANGISKEKYISLIKSIRFDAYKNCNSHWKPSEEQMQAVKHAYNSFPNDCLIKSNLRLLYHDLEKLM